MLQSLNFNSADVTSSAEYTLNVALSHCLNSFDGNTSIELNIQSEADS